MAQKARETLLAKKGEQVVILDVRDQSSVTDYFVIATGNNVPHLKALLGEVERVLEEDCDAPCYRRSGTPESHWLVADFLDVVVHVFSKETRSYYALESLWKDAARVGE